MIMSSPTTEENANTLVRVSKGERQIEIRSSDRTLESRKSARDARSRLLSDSSEEVPKSILKNRSRIPTKRSVSECVDDLSQIMADLDITIDDLSKATGKFCPHKHFFDEGEEEHDGPDEYDADDQDDDDCDADADEHDDYEDEDYDDEIETEADNKANCLGNNGDQMQRYGKQRKCDCKLNVDDTGDSAQIVGNNNNNNNNNIDSKPKKSVRFDEKVYETYFIASRLYDRRCFAKYHSSTRHHPPTKQSKKQQQNKTKKSRRNSSKNPEDKSTSGNKGRLDEATTTSTKGSSACKLSKSQRAKQSKKDKKRKLNRRTDDGHDSVSSDDQGYCSSSFHSSSD